MTEGRTLAGGRYVLRPGSRYMGPTTWLAPRTRTWPSGPVEVLVDEFDLGDDAVLASLARVVHARRHRRRTRHRPRGRRASGRPRSPRHRAGLPLRAAQATVPSELADLAGDPDHVIAGLTSALDEARGFASGIHPVILTHSGLQGVPKTPARRSATPVELSMHVDERLRKSREICNTGASRSAEQVGARAVPH
jgi:hypothetical protein